MRRPIIGVVGGGPRTAPEGSVPYVSAGQLGALIADAGAILLCGGGGGIMEAAAVGAREAGGHTIGIMPSDQSPNRGIEYAVYTFLGDGRNYVNATLSDVVIAMEGAEGTLSEIALALKGGKTVICLSAWEFLQVQAYPGLVHVTSPEAALTKAFEALGIQPGEQLTRLLDVPSVPDQAANMEKLAAEIANW
jgi:uncharacterized protein (TIGR00725 family)